ncbi:MAG: tetratricopeptide repeat protein [Pseudomonadota bacterium]
MIEDTVLNLSPAQQDTLDTALQKTDAAMQRVLSMWPIEDIAGDTDAVLPEAAALAETRTPEQWQALHEQALDALRHAQPEEALDVFVQLVEHRPLDAPYLFGFALCFQQLGQLQEATGYFSLAHALEPSDGACAFRLGECLLALGHVAEAQDALRAAIELDAVAGADPVVREMAQQLLDQIL